MSKTNQYLKFYIAIGLLSTLVVSLVLLIGILWAKPDLFPIDLNDQVEKSAKDNDSKSATEKSDQEDVSGVEDKEITDNDEGQEGEPYSVAEEPVILPTLRETVTTRFECQGPFMTPVEDYIMSVAVLPSETLTVIPCGIKVEASSYTFQVKVSFEGVGYTITDKKQVPEVVEVETPNLDVKYGKNYFRKKIVRLSRSYYLDPGEEPGYVYTSYYSDKPEECSEVLNKKVYGCGLDSIVLAFKETDFIAIDVTCNVDKKNDSPENCDQLIETLSVEKVE
ncbi:hypothetical protein KC622_02205 [Candidatus Dojkabacteria bacterium]|uniref:Uncharacterized protein n=1 Tax=Candidatus Dojkabacteria bacterium TaxID=2099670 RepID=A0A955HY06_9BACT|nr:hypothetical protein [Candidatus Dojkabacteria bacterium]MCB9790964.1 hypothetical protein [Candidatus Nomurabacteria bacterium]